MNQRDWPLDPQMMLETIADHLCHRLLILLSPTYRVLEALGDPRAQQMKDAIVQRIEENDWLATGPRVVQNARSNEHVSA
jgi:hypothetical protein